jgi:hypothetical protein
MNVRGLHGTSSGGFSVRCQRFGERRVPGDESQLGVLLVRVLQFFSGVSTRRQVFVWQFLASFREFPPRMKAASFSIDQVMERMKSSAGGGGK